MEKEPAEESQESQNISETDSADGSNINVIRVRFEEFDQQREKSQTENVAKGKYYKQTYRSAWESMPDFKGWLRGVVGEPTRAYCLFCEKSLHAHRLSLLKHTCTIRHQKAAQLHNNRKTKAKHNFMEHKNDRQMSQPEEVIISEGSSRNHEVTEMVNFEEVTYCEEDELENDDEDDDEEEEEFEPLPPQFHKQFQTQAVDAMSTSKPPISTHVLNTARGIPVVGLQVSLYKLIEGRWTYINEGVTSNDGRFTNFIERGDFTPGRYKLHYDVDRYFEVVKQDSLYPFIEIVFDCRAPNEHYHIPLLLSPFGYTTYRGT